MESLDKVSLHLRQFDVCSVTAAEARYVYRHLLTFKFRRNTTCKDNDVHVLELIENISHIKSRLEVLSEFLLSLDILLEGVLVDCISCSKCIHLIKSHSSEFSER